MRSNINFIKQCGQIWCGSVTVSVHFKVNVSKGSMYTEYFYGRFHLNYYVHCINFLM